VSLYFFEAHERKETRREGEGSVYSDQQTGVIETKPAVKIQSASASPGIATVPRSVVQVPIPDCGSTGSGRVAETVSMLSGDEEVNEGGDEESGHGDDEGEMEEINHENLSETVVTLNETPPAKYDLMADLLHDNMFKVYSDDGDYPRGLER
jgi:hypothetical protein